MKKFTFSLQYLLDVYKAREQASQHALSAAHKSLKNLESALTAVKEARKRQVQVLEQMTGVVQRMDLAASMRKMDTVHQELNQLEDGMSRCMEEVEACREVLRKEMTARQVLENLCERERDEWVDEVQVEDQKQMDELSIGRWNRSEKSK